MSIRWPDGRRQLDEFAQWLDENYAPPKAANLLASLRELLYPLKFDSLAEHLRAKRCSTAPGLLFVLSATAHSEPNRLRSGPKGLGWAHCRAIGRR